MNLTVRRSLLTALLIPALAGCFLSVLAWTAWTRGENSFEIPSYTARWWSSLRPAENTDLLWAMAGISFLSVFPLLGEILLRRRFGRSPSPEIFFMRFFLLTLPFQAARLLLPLVSTGLLSPSWGLTITRIAWFARFLGISALLSISIFSTDMPFRRSGSILGIGALAAMAIAVMMPLDITRPLGNLLYLSGTETALALVTISLEVLAVAALAGSAYIQENNRYYLLTLSLLLVAAGTDLIFFLSAPLIIPGAVFIITGVISFAELIRKIYQWI
jgi:hypothetical protein